MAIHRFVREVQQGEELILFGDGTAKRDYTYIADIVDGFEAALAYEDKAYQVFNLGRGNAVDLRYLISLIEKALNRKARMRSLALQPGDVPLTLADISRARNLLGYHPKVSVEQGIPRFVQWYLENGRSHNEGSAPHQYVSQ
jgi:UDP-glucuronate 4-epimerase